MGVLVCMTRQPSLTKSARHNSHHAKNRSTLSNQQCSDLHQSTWSRMQKTWSIVTSSVSSLQHLRISASHRSHSRSCTGSRTLLTARICCQSNCLRRPKSKQRNQNTFSSILSSRPNFHRLSLSKEASMHRTKRHLQARQA